MFDWVVGTEWLYTNCNHGSGKKWTNHLFVEKKGQPRFHPWSVYPPRTHTHTPIDENTSHAHQECGHPIRATWLEQLITERQAHCWNCPRGEVQVSIKCGFRCRRSLQGYWYGGAGAAFKFFRVTWKKSPNTVVCSPFLSRISSQHVNAGKSTPEHTLAPNIWTDMIFFWSHAS